MYVCMYVYMNACIHVYVYNTCIYMYAHPPTTRGNALLFAQVSTEPQIQKAPKSKIPKS